MKIEQVAYGPERSGDMQEKLNQLLLYRRLAGEFGLGDKGDALLDNLDAEMNRLMAAFQQMSLEAVDPDEPDDLEAIRAQRPEGPRRMCRGIPSNYAKRLRGAFYGRMIGCTLGAALEFHPMQDAENWAKHFGDAYPLQDYWKEVHHPDDAHYIVGKKIDLTRGHMDAVPPDDDTIYTLLGLLNLEQNGLEFTQEMAAELWMRYLPLGPDEPVGMRGCWWGERSMLKNLHAGMALPEAGVFQNPNLQNIAAWTRADAYAYALPGWPEKAAEMAWKDAMMNHRRNGVYGAMFMAAAISAAFVVDDPMEAVRIGLTEIPENCLFAQGVRWALAQPCKDYREAHDAVWLRYKGMFNGSALTNALHVVMGLNIGQRDFTRTIGETVAMSGDNDCTGATAGSIVGAVIGLDAIPPHWYEPFQGRMHIYLNEHPEYLLLEDVCCRFEALAERFSAM